MKKILFSTACFLFTYLGNAQQILFQNFSGGAPGWELSNGISVGSYDNFNNSCITENGIITPGVGGNNPAKVLSEIITPNKVLIEVQFDIDRYNSNLTCFSHSDFGCPTSVDILAVESTYSGTDPIGDLAVIYSDFSGYLLPISGGTVSLIINLPNTLPDFRVFFNFSTDNCNQGGTKYVLDNFVFTGRQPCQVVNTCPPVANNDYFNSGFQNFENSTLFANVYGTNLAYTPPPAHSTYTKRSLNSYGIAVSGGKDEDIDAHPLSAMTFTLVSQDFLPVDANFILHADGTFSFLRLNPNKNQFFFTYRITDPQNNSDDAIVRIDYSIGGPLPVKLTKFNAIKTNNGVMLSWETAQEFNNKGFDILRKTNGNFEKIGYVPSAAINGNSASSLSYNYQDRLPMNASTIFYRLAQIDIDGKQFLSDIRAINNGSSKQVLLVYPNPSKGNLQVILPSNMAGNWDLIIFNANGAAIRSIYYSSAKRVDINGLQPGIYIVKVFSHFEQAAFVKKLIVQ